MNIKAFILSFLKYQTAAIIATGVDFGLFFLLKYSLGFWYVAATFVGALGGAFTNFTICRYWAFAGANNKLVNQITKYIMVAGGSLILNTSLVYLFTELFKIPSDYSRIGTAIIVAICYNFILQKYYVFKQ
ncbi:MAG: GtrA family protein [Vicingus serpentipes]|nr:GtrA family protein [Vicingus serpentipes]